MRKVTIVVVIFALSLLLGGQALAHEGDHCSHDTLTIESLRTCVQHAREHGFITRAGVANSLLTQLDAAQAALDRGDTQIAVSLLEAFVREVSAQAGRIILQPHADHLVEHAQLVIQALNG